MASIFCTNCGAKHEYAGFAPNFCSKCGNQINDKLPQKEISKKLIKKEIPENQNEEESEDSTNIDELPDLEKLDIEIEMEGGFRAFSLEELSKTPANAKAKKFTPTRHSGIGDLSPTKYKSPKNAPQD